MLKCLQVPVSGAGCADTVIQHSPEVVQLVRVAMRRPCTVGAHSRSLLHRQLCVKLFVGLRREKK